MSKPWDNENRTRYYGKRVGDIVEYTTGYRGQKERATVVGYALGDNNRIFLSNGKGKPWESTAERCTVVERVEDIEARAMNKDTLLIKHKTRGVEVHFMLEGLLRIAKDSGNIQMCTWWLDGQTGYAMSIRKDTGKQLVTMMTMAKYIELRGTANNAEIKLHGWRILEAAALRLNLETHFEAEIKAAKEAALKQ